jgi:exopolysaccharide production protein ExoY
VSSNFDLLQLESLEADCGIVNNCNQTVSLLNRVNCWHYRYVKRALDLAGAVTMSVVFLLPAVAIAIAVLLDSPGGVFYRELRLGRDGQHFEIWKFRSMSRALPNGPDGMNSPTESSCNDDLRRRTVKLLPDPRLTRVGAFIRRWSLDELPQLLNVFRGEMSLVGPRPIVEAELPLYGDLMPFYLSCAPGLSGLWQISGRSDLAFASRVILDAGYVRSWSLFADIRILVLTLPAVLSRRGAR